MEILFSFRGLNLEGLSVRALLNPSRLEPSKLCADYKQYRRLFEAVDRLSFLTFFKALLLKLELRITLILTRLRPRVTYICEIHVIRSEIICVLLVICLLFAMFISVFLNKRKKWQMYKVVRFIIIDTAMYNDFFMFSIFFTKRKWIDCDWFNFSHGKLLFCLFVVRKRLSRRNRSCDKWCLSKLWKIKNDTIYHIIM